MEARQSHQANVLPRRSIERCLRPLVIVTAALFLASLVFPVGAGIFQARGVLPAAWGPADVTLTFMLAGAALLVIFTGERLIDKPAADAAYRVYRVLIHGFLVFTVVYMTAGDRVVWRNCITGFAWRAWLMLYALPAWIVAMRVRSVTLPVPPRVPN